MNVAFLAKARAMFEPDAEAVLFDHPADEGNMIIAFAVYGDRGTRFVREAELLDQMMTATWFECRKVGMSRAETLVLLTYLGRKTQSIMEQSATQQAG